MPRLLGGHGGEFRVSPPLARLWGITRPVCLELYGHSSRAEEGPGRHHDVLRAPRIALPGGTEVPLPMGNKGTVKRFSSRSFFDEIEAQDFRSRLVIHDPAVGTTDQAEVLSARLGSVPRKR